MDSKTTINNPKHKSDFAYATEFTQWLFTLLGVWPVHVSAIHDFFRPVATAMTCVAIMFLLIPTCCFMYEFASNITIQMKLIGTITFSCITIFKLIILIYRQNEIGELLRNVTKDWQEVDKPENRKVMLEFAKTGRILSVICVLLLYGGAFLYLVVVPLKKKPIIMGNLTIRHLPIPAHFYFFNPRIRPVYDFMLAGQSIACIFRYAINCGVFSIVIVLVMHVSGQIVVTNTKFERLIDDFDYKTLGEVVRSHLNFLKIAQKIEDIFNSVFLVETFGSTFNICLLGYYFITEFEENKKSYLTFATYIVLELSFVFNIFILCYIGQTLQHYCDNVGDTTYNTRWYDLPAREAWHLLLLISCKQRPMNLTAGKMMNLSLETFIKIIKTAAGSLNMLRNIIAHSKATG